MSGEALGDTAAAANRSVAGAGGGARRPTSQRSTGSVSFPVIHHHNPRQVISYHLSPGVGRPIIAHALLPLPGAVGEQENTATASSSSFLPPRRSGAASAATASPLFTRRRRAQSFGAAVAEASSSSSLLSTSKNASLRNKQHLRRNLNHHHLLQQQQQQQYPAQVVLDQQNQHQPNMLCEQQQQQLEEEEEEDAFTKANRALSLDAQRINDSMIYLEGAQIYACVQCRTHLTSHDDIISKSFHGRHGRAYLFDQCVNVKIGPAEDRLLITGLHSVCDIFCKRCKNLIGWTYKRAYEASQKYKEGKYIIEKINLHLETGDYYDVSVPAGERTDRFRKRSTSWGCGADASTSSIIYEYQPSSPSLLEL